MKRTTTILWGMALVLTLAVLATHLTLIGGFRYLLTRQLGRHLAVLNGTALSPWVYRLLPEWIAWGITGVTENPVLALILTRILTTLLAFAFVILWWDKLGIRQNGILLGVIILGYGLFWTFFESDLSSGTFFEVALCSALCIYPALTIPLSILVALNRETTILIFPGLLLAAVLLRKYRMMIIYGIVAFALTYLTIRFTIGPRATMDYYGKHIGWEILRNNLLNLNSWLQLIRTFSFIPLISLFWWKQWPLVLKRLAVTIPFWFGAVFIGAAVQETRLLLVPFVIVLLPVFLNCQLKVQEYRCN